MTPQDLFPGFAHDARMALPVIGFAILDGLLAGIAAIEDFILDEYQVILFIQSVFPVALAILCAPGGGD